MISPVNRNAALKTSLLTGFGLRLALVVLGTFAFTLRIPLALWKAGQYLYYGSQPVVEGIPGILWGVWQRWDGIHYFRIAQGGYSSPELSAFFPLYPILGRIVSSILNIDILASFCLISLACTIISFYLLYRIIEDYLDQSLARPTVLMMALFPSSFFFFAPYPQSLGMMMVLLAISAALRGRWLWVALCGLCAGLTHSTVVPLSASLFILALPQIWTYFHSHLPSPLYFWIKRHLPSSVFSLQKRNWISLLTAFTPILGTISFLVWREWQNFQVFGTFMLERWDRTYQWPWTVLIKLPEIIQLPNFTVSGWANLASFFLAIAVCIWAVRNLPAWLWIYQIMGLILISSQGIVNDALGGFNRYALCLFPIFIALAKWTEGHKILRLNLYVVFTLLQFYFCFLFMMWVWVG